MMKNFVLVRSVFKKFLVDFHMASLKQLGVFLRDARCEKPWFTW